jgi:magnesium chelatase subunit I
MPNRNRSKVSRAKPALGNSSRIVYPFCAIVGQDEMKLALILSVIDPNLGGVIIMGHRGTGKSTAVRALADLLPSINKVMGCKYGCDPERLTDLCHDCLVKTRETDSLPVEAGEVPVIDLPLGATEDRVCGTLDIERALLDGAKAFEPGLLAKANRGFLYIDEVNLLDDHLVDLLLDTAASGRNIVERESISIAHPARFVLIGSGNPEEGELRPQLLDRFGLFTQVETIADLDKRVEIILRRERFEANPQAFRQDYQAEQDQLRERIVEARKRLNEVELKREHLRLVARLCLELATDGHRGELTITRAARALAAFDGRLQVSHSDIRRVAIMALRHRLRKDPLEKIDSSLRIEQAMEGIFPHSQPVLMSIKL